VFGDVRVSRIAYRARGHSNLHPADEALNLPQEKQSHGARAAGGDRVHARLVRQRLGDDLARNWPARGQPSGAAAGQASVVDFEQFYEQRERSAPEPGDALVLSCDGKGVVMRPETLRPATKKQAESAETKVDHRLVVAR
jgi:hypothetical protein